MRRPTWGVKPPKPPRKPFAVKFAPAPAAPRRFDFERIVAEAIDTRRLLSLRYDDDMMARTFQPTVLYHSSGDKVCVSGLQIGNPAEPRGKWRTASVRGRQDEDCGGDGPAVQPARHV